MHTHVHHTLLSKEPKASTQLSLWQFHQWPFTPIKGNTRTQKMKSSSKKESAGSRKTAFKYVSCVTSDDFFSLHWEAGKRAASMLRALVWFFFLNYYYFTMVNRPEDLAEGTGADHLLMVIWKEGSGEEAFTYRTDSCVVKRISMMCCFCYIAVGWTQQVASDCVLDWQC